MVKVPEDHDRTGQRLEGFDLHGVAGGREAIAPRRGEHVSGITAIPRHAAFAPQLGERDVPAVVAEDDPQRCGAAFDGFHL